MWKRSYKENNPSDRKEKNQESKHKRENNLPVVESCRGPPASRAREEEVSSEGLHSKKELGPVRDKSKNSESEDKINILT